MQEQGVMKYHTSSCYQSFQRYMAKTDCVRRPLEQPEPTQQVVAVTDTPEPHSKRFKPSVPTYYGGSNCLTVIKENNTHIL